MSGLKRIIHEIHRRSLWQVLAIYLVAAWIGYEVIQALTEGLGLPTWFPAFAIVLFIIGLPIVLATALVQEGLGPIGRRDPTLLPEAEAVGPATAAARREATGARRLFTWRNAMLGGVLAGALWVVVAAGWLLLARDIVREAAEAGVAAASEERLRSIAVLPFVNMSEDPENEFFTAGIHDDILSQLSKIRDLTVISRTSIMQYEGTKKDMRTIAEELGVGTILEGSVRRAGGQVRIVTQLIDAEADAHLWSETYDRELTVANVFAIQSDVAEQIAWALQAEFSPEERERIESKPTDNTEAYDFYLRGNGYYWRPGRLLRDFLSAQQMYERAVELDPRFALAHASLSRLHSGFYHFGHDRSDERLRRAREAVDRALELDPDLSEAHLALGWYYYWGFRDYERALAALEIAERGLPADSDLLLAEAAIAKRQGKFDEARSINERAAELNPRDPLPPWEIAITLRYSRRYAEAERYYERALALAPDLIPAAIHRSSIAVHRDGDTGPLRSLLSSLAPGIDPSGMATYARWQVEFLDRDYAAALDVLASTDREHVEEPTYFYPKPLLEGLVHLAAGNPDLARAAFDSARVILETRIAELPDDARLHSALGHAYAGLGRKEEAIRAGLRAVEIMPISRDAEAGPDYRLELARIYAMVREDEAAIEQFERYLSGLGDWSIESLLLDPRTDSLRDHPQFQALLDRHRRNDAG